MREVVARPERPRRCTLPITALRVTPPRRPAIWLALKPSAHSFFRRSTLSSFQAIALVLPALNAAGPANTQPRILPNTTEETRIRRMQRAHGTQPYRPT